MISTFRIKVPHRSVPSYIQYLNCKHLQRAQTQLAFSDSINCQPLVNERRLRLKRQGSNWSSLHLAHLGRQAPEQEQGSTLSMFTVRDVVKTVGGSPAVSTSKRYRALFLDAAGTLISPSEPVQHTYQRFAEQHGVTVSQLQMKEAFRKAFHQPTDGLRYTGDGRSFWRCLVQEATGSESSSLFEDIYGYYCRSKAWTMPADAVSALVRLKDNAIPVVVVSNFDTRLKEILTALGARELLEEVVVSAEIEAEKPDKAIFEAALSIVDQPPDRVIHVGDHEHNDIWGAQQIGIDAWLWGRDVHSFTEITNRILT